MIEPRNPGNQIKYRFHHLSCLLGGSIETQWSVEALACFPGLTASVLTRLRLPLVVVYHVDPVQAADRFNVNRQWEHLQAKYVGTGHADTTKFKAVSNPWQLCFAVPLRSEWAVNQHRDTLASHLGHSDMLAFFAVAENEAIGRVRYNMLEKMLQPCGPPPQKEED
ncbi:hypothetical protein BBJ28_00015383 [Nothophytophthora sp. Chile5]|nr:hypothetical protein BBJ28_00015383 [Nothophytophthora sp. Chile5]